MEKLLDEPVEEHEPIRVAGAVAIAKQVAELERFPFGESRGIAERAPFAVAEHKSILEPLAVGKSC